MKFLSLGWLAILLPVGCIGLVEAATRETNHDETRTIDAFHSISNSGSIVVNVRFGEHESVRLEGDAKAIEEIETVVEGGTLKIRYKSKVSIRQNWERVTAYVTARRIEALSQSGSGSITVVGKLKANELNASLSGSGHVVFESDVDVCNASLSGSGRITANGRATKSNVSISGSGRFDGRELKSQSANLKISGSGTIAIHANDQLDASVSGSGSIRYSGNAKANFKKSGSGSLRKI